MSDPQRSARTPHTGLFAGLLVLLATAGCQSAPPGAVSAQDPREGVQPPPVWSQDGGAAPLAPAYWEAFGSPTLDALVSEGLAASPSLASASLRVVRAAAFLDIAEGQQLPTVNASLDAARSRLNFVGLPFGGGGVQTSTTNNFGLAVNVAWELDLWGRLAAAERAAVGDLEATALDAIGAELSLAGQIAKAAVTLAELDASVELAEQAVELAERIEANERRLLENGTGQAVSTLSAAARVADGRATLSALQSGADAAETALATLLGRAAGNIDAATREALRNELLAADLPPAPAAGVPAELMARRPDLAAAEARVRAAQAGAESARAALYPQLSLVASAGTSSAELEDLLDADFRVWSLGANLVAPLFNGGVLRAREDQAITDRDLALLAFVESFLQACAEVDGALKAEAHLTRELQDRHDQRDALLQVEELLARSQSRGSAASSQVLAASAETLVAETRLVALRRALLHNRMDLYLALGGGFTTSTP